MTTPGADHRPLAPQLDDILTCVHCGFCLTACPTYEVLGDENDSPRGRIYLMRAVAEGRLEASDPSFALHIDRCLGCRACEPVCPSGVRYGFLLEHARDARAAAGGVSDRLARLSLNLVFGARWLQNLVWALLRLLRFSRVPRLLAMAGRRGVTAGRLRFAMAMLAATTPARRGGAGSPLQKRSAATRRGGARDDAATGQPVALLEGCVMAGLFSHVNRATNRVARAYGARTVSLPAGLCCGALHAHAGELETARSLARKIIRAFEAQDAEILLTNSAGCGAALKEYAGWLGDDAAYADRAERLSRAARDVSEWLAERPQPALRSIKARVGHDAPCHQLHAQRIADAPLGLLRNIEDLEVVPLPHSDRCCGGAGIYGLTQRELAATLLQRKLEEVAEAKVEWVATGNPGCLMQIGAGAIIHRVRVQALHPIELIDAALEAAS